MNINRITAIDRLKTYHIDTTEIQKVFDKCSPAECSALAYLYMTMPLSDAVNYSPGIFLDYVKCSVELLAETEFCKNIPTDIFNQYVLFHRVNNEEISPCRTVFREKLKPRINHQNMYDVAHQVNIWCGENVSYRSSDDRTAAAMTIYDYGWGRCGEQSVFTVSALRSVGIPARQLYVPWWSHCDDNHAWVEYWCDGKWYFFGAGEPVLRANHGWFTRAASRAMLVQTPVFDTISVVNEEPIKHMGKVAFLNRITDYIITKDLTVSVKDVDGNQISGALVEFQVVNYGSLKTIASLYTDPHGEVHIKIGKGSLYLTATKDVLQAEQLVNPDDERVELILNQGKVQDCKFIFYPPHESDKNIINLTDEEKKETLRLKADIKKIHREKVSENKEIQKFLKKTKYSTEWKEEILKGLSSKDLIDIKAEILTEHLEFALKHSDKYPKDIFIRYLLAPRIDNEILTAYRKEICSYLTDEEKSDMYEYPKRILYFLEKKIKNIKNEEYPALITTPVACLRSGVGSDLSKNILFVAIARSLGIPAHLTDGVVHYYLHGKFHVMEKEKTGNLCLLSEDEKIWWHYNHNWSIAVKKDNVYKTLDDTDFSKWEDGVLNITLPEGEYRLTTTNRLPNCNNCCKLFHFNIYENKKITISISLYEVPLSDMLDDLDIQDFILLSDGVEYKKSSLINHAGGKFIWLCPGEEPSEHILNEMYNHFESYLPYRESIHLIIDKEHTVNETLAKVADKLNLRVYTEKEPYNEILARRVFCEPDVYPFIMMLNEKGNCLCAKHGYYVGNSGLMLKIFGRKF